MRETTDIEPGIARIDLHRPRALREIVDSHQMLRASGLVLLPQSELDRVENGIRHLVTTSGAGLDPSYEVAGIFAVERGEQRERNDCRAWRHSDLRHSQLKRALDERLKALRLRVVPENLKRGVCPAAGDCFVGIVNL